MDDIIPSLLCGADKIKSLISIVPNQIMGEILHAAKAGRNSVLYYVEDGNYNEYMRMLENLGYLCQYTQVGVGDYILIRWGYGNVD